MTIFRGSRRAIHGALLTLVILLATAAAGDAPAQTAVRPRGLPRRTDVAWMQSALDGWKIVCRELRIAPSPLPWIVLIDEEQSWHLAPERALLPKGAKRLNLNLHSAGLTVPAYAVRHGADGRAWLPNGATLPLAPIAVTMLYANDAKAFFVVALPSVFRHDQAAARDPLLDVRLLSAISHELVHTRQLPAVARRLAKSRSRTPQPLGLNDNSIQESFGSDAEFANLIVGETNLLYRAAREPDKRASLALTRTALDAIERRRARFFVAEKSSFTEVEDVFLVMEGVAEWSRFRLEQILHRVGSSDAEILDFLRGRNNDWSQDEGLALFLLLDRFVPDWRRAMMRDEFPSAVELLRSALREHSS